MDQHYCDIEELLLEMHERTTPQKHDLIERLLTPTKAWTAKQLLEDMGRKRGDITTIHRNLNHLKESGIIQIALNDNGETVYERADDKHHDHLKCSSCGTYQCLPCPEPKLDLKHKQQIKITAHELVFQGLCSKCA